MGLDVAIVGGGAAGLATAHLLDEAHRVVLYEKEPRLGGHIRTLGRNVPCGALPAGVHLDAGVIEFDRGNFPLFHALMRSLDVDVETLAPGGASQLFLADGTHYHSPEALRAEHPERVAELRARLELVPLLLRRRRFLRTTRAVGGDELATSPIERFLSDDDFSTWVRSLLMYAYSTPYEEVRAISAAMAVPMLRAFLWPNDWTRIPGGVFRYVEALTRGLRGEVVLDAGVSGLRRTDEGVVVCTKDGFERRFDRVVLAVPPHRVLPLLRDADETERALFDHFEGGTIETLVHTDTSLHERVHSHYRSEFDLFELPSGAHGYDAYLNRLAGLPTDRPPHYALAFGLEGAIDPETVLHRQTHDVARYSERALGTRAGIEARQGERHTFFAGAYLGDGLHEGAIRSAVAVAARLGGRALVPQG
ncbi:MAG: FAD-dependent oxidoreductase [Polyangiales bacterium]